MKAAQMRILITGACGFVGSTLALELRQWAGVREIIGMDNFIREGAEANRERLKQAGIKVFHADLRAASDIMALPAADWVIDAAANPSVLAGLDARCSSRQIMEHNLLGTVNLLEYCKQQQAGIVLLSTSRVYSITALSQVRTRVEGNAFVPDETAPQPAGVSSHGVAENFSTTAPISLYGATKLASEALALEYGGAFDFPVWINRCGVLAGAGQFGRPDQGIFAYWINAYLRRQPLKYIGFGGHGHQVRDCLHPRDLLPLLKQQMAQPKAAHPKIINVAGGSAQSMSLAQLSEWCAARFGSHPVQRDEKPRPYDIPWMVLDARVAQQARGWKPQTSLTSILEEIARHAEANPHWLRLSGVV